MKTIQNVINHKNEIILFCLFIQLNEIRAQINNVKQFTNRELN